MVHLNNNIFYFLFFFSFPFSHFKNRPSSFLGKIVLLKYWVSEKINGFLEL